MVKTDDCTMDEIGLKQCAKCECLIVSDSTPEKCITVRKGKDDKYGTDDESSDGILLTPKCHDTVKIVVKRQGNLVCKDMGVGPEATNSKKNEQKRKNSKTPMPPKDKVDTTAKQLEAELKKTEVKKLESESKKKPEPVEEKKSGCFGLCRKKKKEETIQKEEICQKRDDRNTQTQRPFVSNVKTQSSDVKPEISDVNIEEIIKNCSTCGKPGGCNTNTIIFPRDKSAGDGLVNLETWLRMETKTTNRNLEDILTELNKQRRDLQELKDMLDTVVRGLREQLFMTAFGKGKNELYEDLKRQKNLERKTNTMSIAKSGEVEPKMVVAEYAKLESSEKQKKRPFPWCK